MMIPDSGLLFGPPCIYNVLLSCACKMLCVELYIGRNTLPAINLGEWTFRFPHFNCTGTVLSHYV